MTTKCSKEKTDNVVDGSGHLGGWTGGEKAPLLPGKGADEARSCLSSIPARYVLAVMSFLGVTMTFITRVDLNIAILSIANDVSNTTGRPGNSTYMLTSSRLHQRLSIEEQNMALSAFYYGYFGTQIVGGYLAGIFGGTRVMGYSMLVTSVLTLVTPPAIDQGYVWLVFCRIVQGMAQGLAQPCMHTIWSKWAPKEEKTKLVTFCLSGGQFGNIVATLATGYLCEATTNLKWALVFYAYGTLGLLWSVSWLLFFHESPRQHPRISKDEMLYIERTATQPINMVKVKPPWGQIFLSPAFLAIVPAHFADDWGNFALCTCMPLYMERILNYDIKQNGLLSSLPFIVWLIISPVAGLVADVIIAKGVLTTKNCRKLMNSIGLFVPSVLMVGVCFVGLNRQLTILLLTMAMGFTGFMGPGYAVNLVDIMPPFSGLLYGISNTLGTAAGFIGPAIVTVLTEEHDTIDQWRIFFFMTAGVFFTGGVIFVCLADGEAQPWVEAYIQKVTTPGSRPLTGESEVESMEDDEKSNEDV